MDAGAKFRWYWLVVILCVVSYVSGGCTGAGSPDGEGEGAIELRSALEELGYGLLITVHPYSCTLTVEDARVLSQVRSDGVKVAFAFVGDRADSVSVSEVAADLELTMPWFFLSPAAYTALSGSLQLNTPTVLLVARGQPLVVVNRLDLQEALGLLGTIYSGAASTS